MSLFAAKEEDKRPAEDEDDGNDDAPHVEEESTAVFVPVVTLTAVEVKTGEDDEDILYTGRAKLFNYGESMLNKNTGTKSWNERGVGDIKLLKHRETSHIRVLMRQEKTMKIIVNHFLDPRINITPNAGASDKSWVWVAFDFSDGAELVETTFAIRFKTAEQAQEFEKEFKAGQGEMTKLLSGADAAASTEAEDVSKALDSLAVSSTDAEKTEESTA